MLVSTIVNDVGYPVPETPNKQKKGELLLPKKSERLDQKESGHWCINGPTYSVLREIPNSIS